MRSSYVYKRFHILFKMQDHLMNQQILQALKEWVIEKKVTEIRLVVYDENILAKNAYRKAGFKAHMLEMRMEL